MTLGLAALATAPAKADIDRPTVETGDHFSQRFRVSFGKYEPYSWATSETFSWRVTDATDDSVVARQTAEVQQPFAMRLRPGKYQVTRAYKLVPAPTIRLSEFIDWGKDVVCTPTSVSTTTQTVPGGALYGPDEHQEYTHSGTIQCVTPEKHIYVGTKQWTTYSQEYGDYWDHPIGPDPRVRVGVPLTWGRFYNVEYPIPNMTMTRTDNRTVRYTERGSFVVKAVNGRDVTDREARAIRVGMSKSQVKAILGTNGTEQIQGNGYEVRRYDGWMTIGFTAGRVNNIQR